MELKEKVFYLMVVLTSITITLIGLGQSDGGLTGILTPYLSAILLLIVIVLPVELILRKAFGWSLVDLVRR